MCAGRPCRACSPSRAINARQFSARLMGDTNNGS
jgi:hypothetical protein